MKDEEKKQRKTIKSNEYAAELIDIGFIVYLFTAGATKSVGKNGSERLAWIRTLLGQPQIEDGVWSKYNAAQVASFISPLVLGDTKNEQTEKLRKLTADADLAQSKAEIAAMKLKVEKGELYNAAAIREYLNELGATVKGSFSGLGSALALQLANIKEPREIQRIIDEKVNGLLGEIGKEYATSNYRFKRKEDEEETEDDEE